LGTSRQKKTRGDLKGVKFKSSPGWEKALVEEGGKSGVIHIKLMESGSINRPYSESFWICLLRRPKRGGAGVGREPTHEL